MKKRTIALLMMVVLMLTLLAGCGPTTKLEENEALSNSTHFRQIEERDDLWYDRDTKIIFYIITTERMDVCQGYGYMAPYISENGKYCKYINDEIVEITEEVPTN